MIRDELGDGATNAGDAVTTGKEEIKLRNAVATATAKDITYEQAQSVRRKPTRTDDEEHAMNKVFMKHDLPRVELNPQFVLKAKYEDNGRWLSHENVKTHNTKHDLTVYTNRGNGRKIEDDINFTGLVPDGLNL